MMETYDLQRQLEALTEGCPYRIANLSNTAALLFDQLKDINWAGFYELQGDTPILGPFQGKPACICIPWGKGVCGKAVQDDKTQRIENVHLFPGHIACDGASNSEIVIPLHRQGKLWGVLDIDSPVIGRFSKEDEKLLTALAGVVEGFL